VVSFLIFLANFDKNWITLAPLIQCFLLHREKNSQKKLR
jgi:hypothetical protein